MYAVYMDIQVKIKKVIFINSYNYVNYFILNEFSKSNIFYSFRLKWVLLYNFFL